MQGLHLTADLLQCRCDPDWLTNAPRLLGWCLRSVHSAGLQAVGQLSHAFPDTDLGPGGVTATVLLAESHLCVHTWPEQGAVTLDVYVCNFSANHEANANAVVEDMLALFQPERVTRRAMQRGAVS